MSTDNYSWNKTLKFSWGHIIAFLALIFISYVTYMGSFYSNGGDFSQAAINVFFIDVALLITFIGAQIIKGTDSKFDRSIIIERILILLCPLAFLWSMIPYNHFWNVFSEREQIEQKFSSSIEKSRAMFTDYLSYANERIENYDNGLTQIIRNKDIEKGPYISAGFSGENDRLQKENFVETLRLQLLSQNTDSLKNLALNWIDNANQGASVWNAFLIGNIDKISEAIKTWNNTLSSVSEFRMGNESISKQVETFDNNQESYIQAIDGLHSLKSLYKDAKGITLNSILTSFLLFFMLLFPYFLQKRNTRATGLYYLIPNKMRGIKISAGGNNRENQRNEYGQIHSTTNSSSKSNDDIYGGTF